MPQTTSSMKPLLLLYLESFGEGGQEFTRSQFWLSHNAMWMFLTMGSICGALELKAGCLMSVSLSCRAVLCVCRAMAPGEDEGLLQPNQAAAATDVRGRKHHLDALLPAAETNRRPERSPHDHPHVGESQQTC